MAIRPDAGNRVEIHLMVDEPVDMPAVGSNVQVDINAGELTFTYPMTIRNIQKTEIGEPPEVCYAIEAHATEP